MVAEMYWSALARSSMAVSVQLESTIRSLVSWQMYVSEMETMREGSMGQSTGTNVTVFGTVRTLPRLTLMGLT